MDPGKSTGSDLNLSLLVSDVDIENVLALNSEYIENLINIDNNYLSALIYNLKSLEEIQLEDDNVEPLKKNISDAISHLKQLESSQIKTNEIYNDNSEVVKESANDADRDNVRSALEFEDGVQKLDDISAIDELNEKMLIGETEKDNEVTVDDKFVHSRMENMLQYPTKEAIGEDKVNDKNMEAEKFNSARNNVDIESHVRGLAEKSTENRLANNMEIVKLGTENANSELIHVIVRQEDNESKENNDDLAELTEVMKTLSKDLNGLEIPHEVIEDVPPEYSAIEQTEIQRNMESKSSVISLKFNSSESETLEEISNTSDLPGIGTLMDFEDMIQENVITQQQPKELIDAKEDKQITDNVDSSKIHISLDSSSGVNKIVDNSITNSTEAKREGINEDTNNKTILFNDRLTAYTIRYTTDYLNSAAKEHLKTSSSDEDDDSNSYHSSDFEMITEEEASNILIVIRKLDQGSANSHLIPLERRTVAFGNSPMRQSCNNNQGYDDDDMPLSYLVGSSHQRMNQAGPSHQRYESLMNQASRPRSQRYESSLNVARPSSQRFVSFDTLNQARPSHQRYEHLDTHQARHGNFQRITRNHQDMITRATNRWIHNNTSVDLDKDFETLDETARANHTMPEGDDSLRIFQELHVPMPTWFMNKSLHYRTVGGMQIADNATGFNVEEANQMYAEYLPEANRTLDMILEAYPEENANARRRRRR